MKQKQYCCTRFEDWVDTNVIYISNQWDYKQYWLNGYFKKDGVTSITCKIISNCPFCGQELQTK